MARRDRITVIVNGRTAHVTRGISGSYFEVTVEDEEGRMVRDPERYTARDRSVNAAYRAAVRALQSLWGGRDDAELVQEVTVEVVEGEQL
jgi:hypothetical protein